MPAYTASVGPEQNSIGPDGISYTGDQNSLAPGTPEFQLWKFSDLPRAWKKEPDNEQWREAATELKVPISQAKEMLVSMVWVELPDTPWGWMYYTWAKRELERQSKLGEFVGVTLVSMHNFREPHSNGSDARTEAANCLRCLLETGKPPQHFLRSFCAKTHVTEGGYAESKMRQC